MVDAMPLVADHPDASASNGDAVTESPAAPDGEGTTNRDAALVTMVGGWMSHVGPTTAKEISAILGISEPDAGGAMLRLEATGNVLRGQFTDRPAAHFANGESRESPAQIPTATEWCDRRLLARIHRLTLGQLRKSISAVNPAQFMRWLLRWQHVAPGTQLSGERGTLEVIRQLQGFEAPANAWEAQILKRRIAAYSPDTLDHLCLTGVVGWARLSPHPATRAAAAENGAKLAARPSSKMELLAASASATASHAGRAADGVERGSIGAPGKDQRAPRDSHQCRAHQFFRP
jgi:ATP-dependent Lhr-like helicase